MADNEDRFRVGDVVRGGIGELFVVSEVSAEGWPMAGTVRHNPDVCRLEYRASHAAVSTVFDAWAASHVAHGKFAYLDVSTWCVWGGGRTGLEHWESAMAGKRASPESVKRWLESKRETDAELSERLNAAGYHSHSLHDGRAPETVDEYRARLTQMWALTATDTKASSLTGSFGDVPFVDWPEWEAAGWVKEKSNSVSLNDLVKLTPPTVTNRAVLADCAHVALTFMTPAELLACAMVEAGGITHDQAMVFATARVEREERERKEAERTQPSNDPYLDHQTELTKRIVKRHGRRFYGCDTEEMVGLLMRDVDADFASEFRADVVPDKRETSGPHPWSAEDADYE